jgi:4-amino-4-deoxy-L-arabinose transferase-like glycosyltransferase
MRRAAPSQFETEANAASGSSRERSTGARNPRRPAERAVAALRAYLAGVPTSRAESVLEAMGNEPISRSQVSALATRLNGVVADLRRRPLDGGPYTYLSLDAQTRCYREADRAVHAMTVVATALKRDGHLEIVDLDVLTADTGAAWTRFLRGLVGRGLSGVRLVVADRHPGLRGAIAELLPGAVWQRSRADAVRDLLAPVPETSQPMVAALLNSIYVQPNRAAVWAQHARIVEQLRARFPETSALLAEAAPDMLAFARFPKKHWPQIWSSDPREPLEGSNNLAMRHHHPNFFVLAADEQSMPRPAGNGHGGGEELNREVRAEHKPLVVAASRPARSEALLNALSGRLAYLWSATGVGSAIDVPYNRLRARLRLAPALPAKAEALRVPVWLEVALVVAGLCGAFAAHAINVFNFPRYELDEGTYMSSAWAILNGQVTAYPYGYGHPPVGWMQIAAWVQLTGGFFAFGNAINSGRVLMLLFALGSSCLVYLIAHRLSGRYSIGLLALVLFSFSPLSLVYQRQVYLDNIGVFWLLLSLYLIVAGKSRLIYIVAAGLSFGLALLSKEVFVVFLPVLIYAVWQQTSHYQKMFGLIIFAYSVVALGSVFVLMAILRGELLPYAWHLPWDHHPHLSMLDTLAHQAERSQSEGRFGDSWYTWTHADPLLIGLSIVATAFNLVTGLWKRNLLFLPLLAALYWAFILRGGVVLTFYIIVLLPLIALNAAVAANTIMSWARRLVPVELVGTLLILGIAVGIAANDLQYSTNEFTQHPTSAQTDAMVWVRNNVPRNAVVVINSYLYMDLRQPRGEGVGAGATYPYAHVYWNIAYDPELHDGLLQNNWDRIDYIVADSEMLHDITTVGGPMLLTDTALHHSLLRQEFRADDNDKQIVISIYQVIHRQPAT